jgi:hypothetical protein
MTADLPIFTMQIRPACVPSELKKLPKDAQVRYEFKGVYVRGTGTEKAVDVIESIQSTIDRQGSGFFTLEEAAHVLAESLANASAKIMLDSMLDAARTSQLIVRHVNTQLPIDWSKNNIHPYHHVKIADIDTWLETQGVDYRFPEAQKKPVKSDDAIDHSALATRQQLISAFGTFTGMSEEWFDNITDKPKLLAARKVVGKSRKGEIVVPLFCPYEVMLWLVGGKLRAKGAKKVSLNTGWRLLQRHFKIAYELVSKNDPRDLTTG